MIFEAIRLLTLNSITAESPQKSKKISSKITTFQQARNLYQAEKYLEAVNLYREIVAAEPRNRAAYFNLGTSLLKLGQKSKANRAVALKYIDEAIKINESILAADPRYSGPWNNLGVINSILFSLTGDRNYSLKEEECYKKEREINPNSNAAPYNLFLINYARRDFRTAWDLFDKAVELKLDDQYAALGTYYIASKSFADENYQQTIELLTRAQRMGLKNDFRKTRYYLSTSYYYDGVEKYLSGQYNKAVTFLEKAVLYDRSVINKNYCLVLAQAYVLRDSNNRPADYLKAINLFTQAINMGSARSWYYFNRGLAYVLLADSNYYYGRKRSADYFSLAVSDLERSAKNEAEAYYWLGYLHEKTQNISEAMKYYNLALDSKISPRIRRKTYFGRHKLFVQLKNFDEARKDLRSGLAIEKNATERARLNGYLRLIDNQEKIENLRREYQRLRFWPW